MKFSGVFFSLFSLCFYFSANAQQNPNYAKTNKMLKEKYGDLLGVKIKNVIRKQNIDTSQIHVIEEPPMILRGFSLEYGDTIEISYYVERTFFDYSLKIPFNQRYNYIQNKKVKGISIYDKRTKRNYHIGN